jgi:putative salt-induced outer membrane protein YdiY
MRWLPLASIAVYLMAMPAFLTAQEPQVPYDLPPLEQPYQDLPPDGMYESMPDEDEYEIAPTESWFHFAPPTLVDWDGGVGLGVNGTEGNAQSFSIRAGANLERETDESIWKGELVYVKTEANSAKTQHQAIMRLRYERLFESPWTWYVRFGGFYDEFLAFDVRLALYSGLGYRFIDSDFTKLKTRLGAGVSREYGGPNDEYVPEGNLGLDFERQLTKRQKFTATLDYFPDWRDMAEYRTVSDLAWVLLLDEESDLNLKVSMIHQYDSTPEDQEPTDMIYGILLLWNL